MKLFWKNSNCFFCLCNLWKLFSMKLKIHPAMGIAEYQSFLFIDYRNLIFGMLDLPYHYKYMAFNFLRGWKNKAGLPFLKKYWKINRISLYRESLKQNYCFNFDLYLHLFKSFFFKSTTTFDIKKVNSKCHESFYN